MSSNGNNNNANVAAKEPYLTDQGLVDRLNAIAYKDVLQDLEFNTIFGRVRDKLSPDAFSRTMNSAFSSTSSGILSDSVAEPALPLKQNAVGQVRNVYKDNPVEVAVLLAFMQKNFSGQIPPALFVPMTNDEIERQVELLQASSKSALLKFIGGRYSGGQYEGAALALRHAQKIARRKQELIRNA